MILTGRKICEEVEKGSIVLSDFDEARVNPNSYNYRLGSEIKIFDSFGEDGEYRFLAETIPESGVRLLPGRMYLGVTQEIIGSDIYAMSLIGRSSMGRYGLFLQVSANLGHTTSCHRWTLELYACQPITLYPGMDIGQVSFWRNDGPIHCYGKTYAKFNSPVEHLR